MALEWGDFSWSIKRWFTLNPVSSLNVSVPEYANNAAAVAAGKAVGFVYRTGDALKVVHA